MRASNVQLYVRLGGLLLVWPPTVGDWVYVGEDMSGAAVVGLVTGVGTVTTDGAVGEVDLNVVVGDVGMEFAGGKHMRLQGSVVIEEHIVECHVQRTATELQVALARLEGLLARKD